MAFELTQQLELEAELAVVDIVFDDALFERYGVTIPVLNFQGNELHWPFDSSQLQIWLFNNGITYHK